jgi:hypothetical protein
MITKSYRNRNNNQFEKSPNSLDTAFEARDEGATQAGQFCPLE